MRQYAPPRPLFLKDETELRFGALGTIQRSILFEGSEDRSVFGTPRKERGKPGKPKNIRHMAPFEGGLPPLRGRF